MIAVVGLGAVTGVYLWTGHRTTIESIAVLPFSNPGGDSNTEYLCDSITEGIINSLSQLGGLEKVIPWIIVARYEGPGMDFEKIKRELGVDAILTGRVAKRGENLAISLELIDVWNNSHHLLPAICHTPRSDSKRASCPTPR